MRHLNFTAIRCALFMPSCTHSSNATASCHYRNNIMCCKKLISVRRNYVRTRCCLMIHFYHSIHDYNEVVIINNGVLFIVKWGLWGNPHWLETLVHEEATTSNKY